MLELAELTKEITGSKAPIEHRDLPADDPKQRRPDITRAKKNLAWEPKISLKDGLAKTIENFKKRLEAAK